MAVDIRLLHEHEENNVKWSADKGLSSTEGWLNGLNDIDIDNATDRIEFDHLRLFENQDAGIRWIEADEFALDYGKLEKLAQLKSNGLEVRVSVQSDHDPNCIHVKIYKNQD